MPRRPYHAQTTPLLSDQEICSKLESVGPKSKSFFSDMAYNHYSKSFPFDVCKQLCDLDYMRVPKVSVNYWTYVDLCIYHDHIDFTPPKVPPDNEKVETMLAVKPKAKAAAKRKAAVAAGLKAKRANVGARSCSNGSNLSTFTELFLCILSILNSARNAG
jgi:hypothetical protein